MRSRHLCILQNAFLYAASSMILVANPSPLDVLAILQTHVHQHFRLKTLEENQLIGRFSCVIDIKTNLDFGTVAEVPDVKSLMKGTARETVAGRLNVPEDAIEVDFFNRSTLRIGIIGGTNIHSLKSHARAVAEDLSSNVVTEFAAIDPEINNLSEAGAFAVTDISINMAANETKRRTHPENSIDTVSKRAATEAATGLTLDTSANGFIRNPFVAATPVPIPSLGSVGDIGDTLMPEADKSMPEPESQPMKDSDRNSNHVPSEHPFPYQEQISKPLMNMMPTSLPFTNLMPVHELSPTVMAFMAAILFFPSLMLLII